MSQDETEEVARRWLEGADLAVPFRAPDSARSWKAVRGDLREDIVRLLGRLPDRPAVPRVEVTSREDRGDYDLERFAFGNGAGDRVTGCLLLPKARERKMPAVLYCHWHAGEYDLGKEELFQTGHMPEPPGPALVRRGFVVMAIDAGGFGERNGRGPGGPSERGTRGEETACKFHLWAGRSFWGMVIHDDLMALDYLASRPEVDPARIGATGMSMGSTRTWWLMALDERIRAGVGVACLTRYRDLARRGALREHHMGYFVPGMLAHMDTEAVVALVAPRALLLQNGDLDPGSPAEGIDKVARAVLPIYGLYGHPENFRSIVHPGQGHVYTEAMWRTTQDWLARHLT
jgi:dienelactone hydrolase